MDGWMTCVKILYTCYESLHMTKSQPNLTHVVSIGKNQLSSNLTKQNNLA
jgi:hypothetical protein